MTKYLTNPSEAKKLQEALIAHGYSCGPDGADGVLGHDSQIAILQFRRDHNLSPTLEVDNEMKRLLGLGPALITEPGTPANIVLDLILAYVTKGRSMTSDQITGILRAILTAIGGYFVAKGLVDQATATAIVGAVLTLVGAAWSIYSNRPKTIVPISQK